LQQPSGGAALVPFSDGPAICPAHNLVPLIGAAMLGAIVTRRELSPGPRPALDPQRLPGTLDPFTLSMRMA
jgi:hypothetical protein